MPSKQNRREMRLTFTTRSVHILDYVDAFLVDIASEGASNHANRGKGWRVEGEGEEATGGGGEHEG